MPKHAGRNREHTTSGYAPARLRGEYRARSLSREGAFFVPHLKPGQSVLDCGCGPGSITVDIALYVGSSSVVGIDRVGDQLVEARALAQTRGAQNATFREADVCALPFDDACFDAVFAHAMLYHVPDPLAAVREIHRVLKPAGVFGTRDVDEQASLVGASNPTFARAGEITRKLLEARGADPYFGRKLRPLLRDGGFSRIEISASFDLYTSRDQVETIAAFGAEQLESPRVMKLVVEQGWATDVELSQMAEAYRAWGTDPDAWAARGRVEAVGWKE